MTEENITLVFQGFLNLTAKEKLRLVERINEYFDSNDREPIRAANDRKFADLERGEAGRKCICCGK